MVVDADGSHRPHIGKSPVFELIKADDGLCVVDVYGSTITRHDTHIIVAQNS